MLSAVDSCSYFIHDHTLEVTLIIDLRLTTLMMVLNFAPGQHITNKGAQLVSLMMSEVCQAPPTASSQ